MAEGRIVRVFVPAEVANNLERMQQVTAEVMARLGCGMCHSGRLLQFEQFEQEHEFYVSARGEVRGAGELG